MSMADICEKATADLEPMLEESRLKMTSDSFVRWRISLGITQIEAAKALGCSRTTIAAYEYGKSKIPRYIALACAAIIAGLRPLE